MRTRHFWLRDSPVAHRGLHGGRPELENSLEAFEAAATAGYPIELDVHLSQDDQLIVHHDGYVNLADRSVPITTLRTADLERSGADLPTLDDVLAVVEGKVPLLVEVKPGSPPSRIGPAVIRSLGGHQGEYAVQSFDASVVSWFRRNHPEVTRGQLVELPQDRFGRQPGELQLVLQPDFGEDRAVFVGRG